VSFSLPPAPANGETGVLSFLEEWADRVGTTPRALALATLTAVAVVLAAWLFWWKSTSSSAEISIPYAAPLPVTATSVEPLPTVLVHVAGAVKQPGVYSFEVGRRVGDAIAAAGGPAEGAELNQLNLAAPLADGTRIYIPSEGEEVVPALAMPELSSQRPENALVNINTADQATLETLPGVGPATAAAIISHRERNGAFQSIDDLIDVRGIGEAKLAAMRERVTI